MNKSDRLPWALGWASLGIGLTEVLFAEGLCRVLGVPKRRADLVRAFGVREISNGWGLLLQPSRRKWTWGRVAGDAIDLVLLSTTFRSPQSDARWRSAITAAVVGVTLVDIYAAVKRGLPYSNSPSPSLPLSKNVPMESWRGSGLAEELGVGASSASTTEAESEEFRQRMMDEAARKLGLPDLKERGHSH